MAEVTPTVDGWCDTTSRCLTSHSPRASPGRTLGLVDAATNPRCLARSRHHGRRWRAALEAAERPLQTILSGHPWTCRSTASRARCALARHARQPPQDAAHGVDGVRRWRSDWAQPARPRLVEISGTPTTKRSSRLFSAFPSSAQLASVNWLWSRVGLVAVVADRCLGSARHAGR